MAGLIPTLAFGIHMEYSVSRPDEVKRLWKMTTGTAKDAEAKLLPPYVSFQSVKTALAQFKEHATPDRIDRSVLTKFSGAIGGQILTAFRFLGLTDANGHSTDALRDLVKAFGTDAWPEALAQVLKKAYAPS